MPARKSSPHAAPQARYPTRALRGVLRTCYAQGMDAGHAALLFGAAFAGGALNSVAGGGSFLTFPALVFTGGNPISANATSTVALWPGTCASAVGYRSELKAEGAQLKWLAGLSALGGLIGSLTLIATPTRVFDVLVPFLMLVATLVFTFGERLRARLSAKPAGRPVVAFAQLLIAIYGGYFGGGMGLMMLAAFTLYGMTDLHRMNALKAGLGLLINGLAVAVFAISGQIAWLPAGVMIAGAIAGGFGGASLARKVDPKKVKPFVVAIGWIVTTGFFYKAFG